MGRKGFVALTTLFALVSLLGFAVTAWPAQAELLQWRTGTMVAPGVLFSTFVEYSPAVVVNVLEIEAGGRAAIRVVPATSSGFGTGSVQSMCASVGAVACINGDMFDGGTPLGGVLANGQWLKYPTQIRQQLWIDDGSQLSANTQLPRSINSIGATTYNLLTPGQPIDIPEHDSFADDSYARTMVGWDEAGDRWFVTVEAGWGTAGMSLGRAAGLMQVLGATTAVNLDGGGSSQMVVNGRSYLAPGEWARPVVNVLAAVPI